MTFGPLVDAAWLASHLDDVVVADVRWYLDGRSGREAYDRGHIPSAVFIELDGALAAPTGSGPGRHPLPATLAFAEALGALGIGDGDRIVAYDDAVGSIAARLWWMLRATGHEAAVLDGGMTAWSGELATRVETRARAKLTVPGRWPDSVVNADDVAILLATNGAIVVDARAPERYRGEVEPIDPRWSHPWGAQRAVVGEHRSNDWSLPRPLGAQTRVGGARRRRQPTCCRVLRFGHHRVPRPAGPRRGELARRTALRRLVVGLERTARPADRHPRLSRRILGTVKAESQLPPLGIHRISSGVPAPLRHERHRPRARTRPVACTTC